jgi:hypothetical protein
MGGRKIFALVPVAVFQLQISACDRVDDSGSERRQLVERCSSLISKDQYEEGAACLRGFENETKPDAQTAAAVFQLGHLYETGRGVPVDLERALLLYRYAGRLGTFAPDIAQQASKSAADLLNRMRESDEDATSGSSNETAGQNNGTGSPPSSSPSR